MPYVYAAFGILAGLGVFLYACKMLQDNVERLANNSIRDLFNKTSNNPFVGIGIGTTVTALVQSSGLTTVMIVGFVNAGIMTLYQATAIILGANIGTTITAQIAALQAFKFAEIAAGFCGVGFFFSMFSKTEKLKSVGAILGGLGMIFVGLQLMSSSMTIIKESPVVEQALASVSNPFILLAIGIVFTALLQSSSAITSIIISMASAGFVIGGGGNAVLYVILGSNIGSCVTALLSSIGTSINARRASIIHLMFNVSGAAISMIILLLWPTFMQTTFETWFADPGTQIAMFHTFFNCLFTIVFIPFINVFVKLSKIIIPDKEEEKTATFLDEKFLKTPSIAIELGYKELILMQDVAVNSLKVSLDSFVKKDDSSINDITAYTEKVTKMNHSTTDYLVKITSDRMASDTEKEITNLLKNVNYIQRLAEMAENITKYTTKAIKLDLEFSEGVNEKLVEMLDKIVEMANLNKQIVLSKDFSVLAKIDQLETETDTFRKQLLNDHIERLKFGKCKAENSSVFINLISNMERCADLLRFVAHSVKE